MKTFKKILLGLLLLVATIGNAQFTGIGNRILINQGQISERPIYISNTGNTVIGSTLTLTTPNDVEVGDLLLILVGKDNHTNTIQWNNTNYKPLNFEFIQTGGDAVSDCHYGAFLKIADGSEGSSINVPSESSIHQYFGFYVHIKGANGTTPLGNLGASYVSVSDSFSHTLNGVAGAIDDLGIYINSFDGGDGFPFSITNGEGWILKDEIQHNTDPSGSSGSFGIKVYDSTDAENVTIIAAISDGTAGFQFRIIK